LWTKVQHWCWSFQHAPPFCSLLSDLGFIENVFIHDVEQKIFVLIMRTAFYLEFCRKTKNQFLHPHKLLRHTQFISLKIFSLRHLIKTMSFVVKLWSLFISSLIRDIAKFDTYTFTFAEKFYVAERKSSIKKLFFIFLKVSAQVSDTFSWCDIVRRHKKKFRLSWKAHDEKSQTNLISTNTEKKTIK
jgi:hypothetical protein